MLEFGVLILVLFGLWMFGWLFVAMIKLAFGLVGALLGLIGGLIGVLVFGALMLAFLPLLALALLPLALPVLALAGLVWLIMHLASRNPAPPATAATQH